MASTDFRAVLNDVFKDSLDAAVLDYLSETLHGGSGLQEVLEPFLIDAGWANDGSVEATCADIERRLGCSRKDDPALTVVREAPNGPQLLSSSIVADLQKLQDADLQKAETCAAQELITEVTVLPEEDVTATGRASAKRGSRSGVNRRRAEDCAMTEQPDLAPWAVSMFSDWESELQRVAGALTPEDVTAMVRTMAELGGTKARVAALRKLAVVIEEGDIGGELLVAGGETVLAEKLSSVLKKSEAGASRIYCREVVQTVQQLDVPPAPGRGFSHQRRWLLAVLAHGELRRLSHAQCIRGLLARTGFARSIASAMQGGPFVPCCIRHVRSGTRQSETKSCVLPRHFRLAIAMLS